MGVGQEEIVAAGPELPLARQSEFLPDTKILDIAPTELVRQPELIVRARIDRIEGVVVAILVVLAPGGVIVLQERTRLEAQALDRISPHPVSRPRADLIDTEIAPLIRHFGAVV